jgi:DNA-binding response OmpR family regulator
MAKIMVTGFPSMQNAISAVNEGADAYIVKPVDAEVLLETIRKHLQKREKEVEYGEQKMIHFIETRSKELTTESRKNQPAP